MTKQQSCEELIIEKLDRTEHWINAMLVAFDREQENLNLELENDMKILKTIKDDDIDENSIHESYLGVDIKKHFRIHLSTGGPADFIEVITDEEDNIIDVYYHYQDWFDGAKRKVDEMSNIYRYAMMILESNKQY